MRMIQRWGAVGAMSCAILALSACGVVREARMAQPASLAAVPDESFGKPGWGRQGDFLLSGQRVRYDRGADRLSLFDTLATGKAPLRYSWAAPAGEVQAECTARQTEVSRGVLVLATKPWTLTCRWSGASDAILTVGEGRVQMGQQTREGRYQRGDLVLVVRSVHRLEGSGIATASAMGYEFLQGERVVGSVDLSRGVPHLRRPTPLHRSGRP